MLFLVDATDAIRMGVANGPRNGIGVIEYIASRLGWAQSHWGFDDLAVLFDAETSFRTEMFPKHLPRSKDKDIRYFEQLQAWLISVGAAWLQVDGFEAVDLAASVIEGWCPEQTVLLTRHPLSAFVMSPTEQVEVVRKLLIFRKQSVQRLNWKEFSASIWRCSKTKWFQFSLVDYCCLTGVGKIKVLEVQPAMAQLLLDQYGSLEGIADALPELRLCGKMIHAPIRRRIERIVERRLDLRACLVPRSDVPLPEVDLTAPNLRRFFDDSGFREN